MGLLKHLLFWPVTGPAFLARFSLEKVQDTVKGELADDARVKEDLLALQMEHELGEVTDEEYAVREAELMQRLREVREWREQFGVPTRGGAVRLVNREGSSAGQGADDDAPSPSVSIELDWEDSS